jgi:2-C-methyl-D-erythritol 2,4-cyclodiphosphate synthase
MNRVGFGFDVHRLAPGRKLILGGEEIPFAKGLLGHSDADILLHAIADSLLGAAALGDIGRHFPDTDSRYKDLPSIKILEHVATLIVRERLEVVNIDSTIVLQTPKISPYVDKMRKNIADALGIGMAQVSIKATTNEGLGFIGAGEGAVAYAIALVTDVTQRYS